MDNGAPDNRRSTVFNWKLFIISGIELTLCHLLSYTGDRFQMAVFPESEHMNGQGWNYLQDIISTNVNS
jgi:hypothetical protein